MLSIASVGVDNDHGNRYEQINGPHAVKLCGTTYHFIRQDSANSKNGSFYFTYDGAMNQLMQHADELNEKYDCVQESVLEGKSYI